jgi:hypothetical protein
MNTYLSKFLYGRIIAPNTLFPSSICTQALIFRDSGLNKMLDTSGGSKSTLSVHECIHGLRRAFVHPFIRIYRLRAQPHWIPNPAIWSRCRIQRIYAQYLEDERELNVFLYL